MSSATVDSAGTVRVLDGKAGPEDTVTEDDVTDAAKLARGLTSVVRQLDRLRRRFAPRRIDFEGVTVSTAGAAVSLEHGFGGRVRWWVVDWESTASTAPYLRKSSDTSDTTLVLLSYVAGTVTVRVEGAG